MSQLAVSIIVPTFNERDSVAELIARIGRATEGYQAEIIFVDDSNDGTEDEVLRCAQSASLPVRVRHRAEPVGGLSGAVIEGIGIAQHDICVVMDGDLQHPPELLPGLINRWDQGGADVVIASRYRTGGDSAGLSNALRYGVSRAATVLTRAMFPLRLARATDPMTGFFLVDRRRINTEKLRPEGFKILLEILVRSDVRIAEVPLEFQSRQHGTSKASLKQGRAFLRHLVRLRFGKMSRFAVIGGIGALVNIGIVALLTSWGMGYVWAAIIGAEVTIIGNFFLQEWFVFRDMRDGATRMSVRFAASFGFNNVEAAIRIPILALLVETWHISAVLGTAITLVAAFVLRFLFHSLVVYAPRRTAGVHKSSGDKEASLLHNIDNRVVEPGEL